MQTPRHIILCDVQSATGCQVLVWRSADSQPESSDSFCTSYHLIDLTTGLVRDEGSLIESSPATVYGLCQVEDQVWVARGPDPEKCSVMIYGEATADQMGSLTQIRRIDLPLVPTGLFFNNTKVGNIIKHACILS